MAEPQAAPPQHEQQEQDRPKSCSEPLEPKDGAAPGGCPQHVLPAWPRGGLN